MDTDSIQVRLPRSLYKRHSKLKSRTELTVAAQLRVASKEYLARQEALEARRARLIAPSG